jgi:hypothetical protein
MPTVEEQLVRELEEVRRAHRQAMREKDEEIERLNRRLTSSGDAAARYICKMDDAEFERFSQSIVEQARAFDGGQLWKKVELTLNPPEIINDVLYSFRNGSSRSSRKIKYARTTGMLPQKPAQCTTAFARLVDAF